MNSAERMGRYFEMTSWLVKQMLYKLKSTASKRFSREMSDADQLAGLHEEVAELAIALQARRRAAEDDPDGMFLETAILRHADVMAEAVDVANYAMFIADSARDALIKIRAEEEKHLDAHDIELIGELIS